MSIYVVVVITIILAIILVSFGYKHEKNMGILSSYDNPNKTNTQKILENKWNSPKLAELSGNIRLQNPFQRGSRLRHLWNIYADHYVPYVIGLCQRLKEIYQEYGANKIALLSRDMYNTWRVFRRIYPDIDSRYVFFSRKAVEISSPEFLKYFSDNVDNKTVVVDLHGTGTTFYNFQQKTGQKIALYVICHYFSDKNRKKRPDNSIVLSTYNPLFTEQLHYSVHGSVIDIQDGVLLGYPLEYNLQDIGYLKTVDLLCDLLDKGFKVSEINNLDMNEFTRDMVSVTDLEHNILLTIQHNQHHKGEPKPIDISKIPN